MTSAVAGNATAGRVMAGRVMAGRAAMSGRVRRGRESGAATVLVAGFGLVLLVMTLLAASLAGLLVGHRRAASAADLAALAGAGAAQKGRAACSAAAVAAAANGARLSDCRQVGDSVTVRADVDVDVGLDLGRLGRPVSVSAWARAGPVP